ncbi:helix-turn-helix transcriptional regulator [Isoptericola sp. S6320L]|uniref:helix-turn-helix transcriptional regulator n=1 Tax=Isoptericola sp. S6320L TaxID=2926411 RepID=UPI001FF3EC08|nr:helix-turn-helix transcriptional regulator [Isoptericola sp. S6320L]MCK0117047.1 helix-turn-helix transcriptional regulator [Isoptericola sp. S6320L]
MASNPPVDALALLGHETRRAVAPHVAARLGRVLGGDAAALSQLAALLRPEHLAGTSLLPDPLPAVPALRSGWARTRGGRDDRSVLLCAAVAVTDRADVLLEAAGDAAGTLVGGLVAADVHLAAGRFRVTDPRMRSVVHDEVDLAARTAAHTALARAARECGEPGVALWHTALSTLAGDELLADGLVELAGQLSSRGATEAAHEVAREAASHGTGERRGLAFLAAGRAALWSGHLADADDWLRRAGSSGVPAVERAAVDAAVVTHALRAGRAVDGSDVTGSDVTGTDGGASAVDRRAGRGAALARLVEPLVRAAGSRTDRRATAAVARCLRLLDDDPARAEGLLARVAVGVVPAWPRPGPWPTADGALSPLAEATVRVVQALLLLRAARVDQAAVVLDDAAARLPVAHVAGGLGIELSRRLDGLDRCRTGATTTALVDVGPPVAEVVRDVGAWAAATAAEGRTGRGGPGLSALVAATARGRSGEAPDGTVDAERPPTAPAAWAAALTSRELEVARLVTSGLTNREVAAALCVSVRTVEVHLGRVFRKLDVRSRSELVVLALSPARLALREVT